MKKNWNLSEKNFSNINVLGVMLHFILKEAFIRSVLVAIEKMNDNIMISDAQTVETNLETILEEILIHSTNIIRCYKP
jgi:hypothetical protein